MYGMPDIYGAPPPRIGPDDEFGALDHDLSDNELYAYCQERFGGVHGMSEAEVYGLFEKLRARLKKRRISKILGKLKTLFDKGRVDKARKKAKRLEKVIRKLQSLEPDYVPDEEEEAWMAFGRGEIDDPEDYRAGGAASGNGIDIFTPQPPSTVVATAVPTARVVQRGMMPRRPVGAPAPSPRLMPRRRMMPQRRFAPKPGPGGRLAGRGRAAPAGRMAPGGRLAGRFGAMGPDYEDLLDEYGAVLRRDIDKRIASARSRFQAAVRAGDADRARKIKGKLDGLLAAQREAREVWSQAPGQMPFSIFAPEGGGAASPADISFAPSAAEIEIE